MLLLALEHVPVRTTVMDYFGNVRDVVVVVVIAAGGGGDVVVTGGGVSSSSLFQDASVSKTPHFAPVAQL